MDPFISMFIVVLLVLLGELPLQSTAEESCTNGLELECKTVEGNGTTCVLGCNSTITDLISPGSCLKNCCKICYSNCHQCVYTRIVTFCIDITNTSWTDDVTNKLSQQFSTFDRNLEKSLQVIIPKHNQTYFKTEILNVQRCSPKSDYTIQVYVKVTINNRKKLIILLNDIKNSTISGKLGNLTLLPDVFEFMSEKSYAGLTNQRGKEESLDVVELIVTCVAALIVILAIIWCLFYLCTTPHERERCNPCKTARITNT